MPSRADKVVSKDSLASEARRLADQNWIIEVEKTETGDLFARIPELPGCMTEASDWEELEGMMEDALVGWLEVHLEHGNTIPEPRSEGLYSGKIFVRASSRLHRDIARAAERDGVSMSQWAAEVLARAVGTSP
ncbi:hypothetical protein BH18ACT15_BH18ACT15_01730 [soil metagenome]